MISRSLVDIWNRALMRIGETDLVESETELRAGAEAAGLVYDDLVRELFEAYPWPWAIRQVGLSDANTQELLTIGDAVQTDFTIPYGYREASQLTVYLVDNTGAETELVAGTDYSVTSSDVGVNAYITLLLATPAADEYVHVVVTHSRIGWEYVYLLPEDCVTPIALLSNGTRFLEMAVSQRQPFAVMPNDVGDGLLLCTDLASTDFDALEYVALIDYVPLWPRAFVDALVWRLAAELAMAIPVKTQMGVAMFKQYPLVLEAAAAQSQNLGQKAADPPTPTETSRG